MAYAFGVLSSVTKVFSSVSLSHVCAQLLSHVQLVVTSWTGSSVRGLFQARERVGGTCVSCVSRVRRRLFTAAAPSCVQVLIHFEVILECGVTVRGLEVRFFTCEHPLVICYNIIC